MCDNLPIVGTIYDLVLDFWQGTLSWNTYLVVGSLIASKRLQTFSGLIIYKLLVGMTVNWFTCSKLLEEYQGTLSTTYL